MQKRKKLFQKGRVFCVLYDIIQIKSQSDFFNRKTQQIVLMGNKYF